MADRTAETAQQSTREAITAAKETAGRGAERISETVEESGEMARRVSEAATNGYEELLTLSRENVEGMARASQAMLNGTSELSSVWTSFWSEQLDKSLQAIRSLSECRSWHDALDVQNEFARSSLERVCSRAAKSAELTAEMVTGSFVPLQKSARRAADRIHRLEA